MTFGKGHHLHLIDGSAYIFRAYHALPPLTRSDGLPVGAVAGFSSILWGEITKDRSSGAATHIAVVFDHSSKTFRNEIYPEYKANRPDRPKTCARSSPDPRGHPRLQRRLHRGAGVRGRRHHGHAGPPGGRGRGNCTIISSDKDLMQLIRPGIDMLDPMKNKPIGRTR